MNFKIRIMSSTRDRLIQAAHDLFYTRGFHAVGLDAILDHVGVTKTTFYNHFVTKEDLVRAVLDWHDQWWKNEFRALLRTIGGDKPRDQLLAVADALDRAMCQGEFNGCFFVNVAVQFPQAHDPAHRAAAQHKRDMEDIIRELAGYAGAADAKAMAEEISLVMEGAYVTRQVTGNPATSQISRRLVQSIVARHIQD